MGKMVVLCHPLSVTLRRKLRVALKHRLTIQSYLNLYILTYFIQEKTDVEGTLFLYARLVSSLLLL